MISLRTGFALSLATLLVGGAVVAACSSNPDTTPGQDAGVDTGIQPTPDAGDGSVNPHDAGPDTSVEHPDAGDASTNDGSTDAEVDAAKDGEADAAKDGETDAAKDGETDAAKDGEADAAKDGEADATGDDASDGSIADAADSG
jgi:hypothetical protein